MKLVLLFTTLLLSSLSVYSQSDQARINGTVQDENGAVVPSARVSVRGGTPRVTRVAVTDASGKFSLDQLQPGRYDVEAIADGFAAGMQRVELKPGEVSDLQFQLSVGEMRLTVSAEVGSQQEKRNVPQAVNAVTSDRISQRATTVLAQAAREEVGLNVQRTGTTLGAIVVRGLTGKNVVNYVDGVRYTNGAQRGGINTFFNLNDASNLQSIEVLRGPSGAQYGSDSLGGTVNMLSRSPQFGTDRAVWHGEFSPLLSSGDRTIGGSGFVSYGTNKLGGLLSFGGRKVGDTRSAGGIDTHSAITRFLGLPSTVLYRRNPETGFQQYGGSFRLNYAPRDDSQVTFYYQRGQQDDGKRFDQMLGGDGNLIADLRNLMLDFGYLRFVTQRAGWFDTVSLTGSWNSQREERVNQGGQGNPFAAIVHQYERTSTWGFSSYLEKQFGDKNTLLIGGDIYAEKIKAPAFTVDPTTNIATRSRPRVPNNATFTSAGLYVQDAWQAISNRLRITAALRYGGAKYVARASDSPLVGGQPLWKDDTLSTAELSGRAGMVLRLVGGLRFAANYSRGFRYPNMTDLGTLGLTGDGFEVDFAESSALGGIIGSTAGADAVSTGIPVSQQRSEISNNIDASLRFENPRFDTELTFFRLDIDRSIVKQALILPPGAVGKFLGDTPIIGQGANGVVYVAASTSPVLVRANFTDARIFGVEYEAEGRINRNWTARGNLTYLHASDKATGEPPNIEGGTPPTTAFLSLKYSRSRFWVEGYSTLAARQNRLSSLDLSDRRTGAPRSQAQIENYFRRGACVAGLTRNATGTCNGPVGGYTLLPTGENITQVLTRVLGPGFPTRPMFTSLPAYGLVNVRGGYNFNDRTSVFVAFENILDQQYRHPSWGIDGTGRSVTAQFRYRF